MAPLIVSFIGGCAEAPPRETTGGRSPEQWSVPRPTAPGASISGAA
jgi:hypothetical protein